tara:strand:+ start:1165 stop:1371 length:207 start_codon:yes stop_codon:yes gene_type:complete
MPKRVQFRRGTTSQNDAFTGDDGELSVNTTTYALRVHDGSTAGGFEMMKVDMSNIEDGTQLDGGTFNS